MMALGAFAPAPADRAGCPGVPPHYVVVSDWREAALNVRHFHRDLSREQQAREWEAFDLPPPRRNELMGRRIEALMADRALPGDPGARPARPLPERALVRRSAGRGASESGRAIADGTLADSGGDGGTGASGRGSRGGRGGPSALPRGGQLARSPSTRGASAAISRVTSRGARMEEIRPPSSAAKQRKNNARASQ